ncbi:MAG TPA: DUF2934 domain-containing protein [Polyangia bacterium]|nr:DUF2934 domain-containing protein [Polyangia bacterium]
MSQTSYPSVSQPSRAKGKAQVAGAVAPSAAKPPKAVPVAGADHATGSVSSDAIAKRAYEKYVARGGAHGSDQEDWVEAERELIAERRG